MRPVIKTVSILIRGSELWGIDASEGRLRLWFRESHLAVLPSDRALACLPNETCR